MDNFETTKWPLNYNSYHLMLFSYFEINSSYEFQSSWHVFIYLLLAQWKKYQEQQLLLLLSKIAHKSNIKT